MHENDELLSVTCLKQESKKGDLLKDSGNIGKSQSCLSAWSLINCRLLHQPRKEVRSLRCHAEPYAGSCPDIHVFLHTHQSSHPRNKFMGFPDVDCTVATWVLPSFYIHNS